MINLAHKLQVIVTRRKIKQVSCNSVREYERKKRQIDREEWLIILIQREVFASMLDYMVSKLQLASTCIFSSLLHFLQIQMTRTGQFLAQAHYNSWSLLDQIMAIPDPFWTKLLQCLIPSRPNYYNTWYILNKSITIPDPFWTKLLQYLIPSGPVHCNSRPLLVPAYYNTCNFFTSPLQLLIHSGPMYFNSWSLWTSQYYKCWSFLEHSITNADPSISADYNLWSLWNNIITILDPFW